MNVRVYDQTLYMQGLWGNSPKKLLEQLGFVVLSIEFDSFGPVYFIELEETDLQLPDWATKYDKIN